MGENDNILNNDRAVRFISCYNQIDNALKMQEDHHKSISYTEAVRKAARTNSLVRKYEEVLLDYGKLRNAIVHSSNEDMVIADPHEDVVQNFEKITNLICTPPLAVDTVLNRNVNTITHDTKLRDVVVNIYKSDISNWPVYKDDMLIGVANSRRIIKMIGKKVYEKVDLDEFLSETNVEDIITAFGEDNYYTIASEKVTLDKVISLFAENRKLALVVITKTGSLLEKPVGIVSIADIMDVNKILDNYSY
ncbi:MAG: CBS domain-containing protein [Clostridia bacterium]|nr:CBS domain-containing protein [Clostridia bacterium]